METATATARPGEPATGAPWRLTDLISVEALQSIQDTFARAFGLPTVIVDTSAVNATTITHRLPFCEDLTRASSAGSRCAECDLCAMRDARATSRPAVFECWNGLYDAAIPIAPKGHVLGYFLCGQIFVDSPDRARYARTADEIGIDRGQYLDALEEVKVVPRAQYEASVESMHVLAQMIADQAAASIDSLQMLEDARRAEDETAQLVEELDTILEALRDIGSQPSYQATLASIADNLDRLIPWDSCVIYLTDDQRDELLPVVVRDPFPEQVEGFRPRKGVGIVGKAALGGTGRRFLDITRDPDFQPIPGVPTEPESALVMPMDYKGMVSGVIVLSRFERRTFTDHELRVLDVFSAQASVSIQVSKLASENAQRLAEERAFSRLRVAMAPRTKVESILAEAAQVGLEVLGADAAVVSAREPGMPALQVQVGLDEAAADALLASVDAGIARATANGGAEVLPVGAGTGVVVPLDAGETHAFAVFARRDGGDWSPRLVESLRAQASLGIEKVSMHDRERRLRLRYQRLSELATELITAHDGAEVRGRLLQRTPEILFGDTCFIALLDQGPDAIAIELRDGAVTAERTIKLEGGARLAAVRLRGEPEPDRSVFDTWSQEVFRVVGAELGAASWLAEPLPLPAGALGGLFVGWRAPAVELRPDERRLLRVVAGAAGTALARFAAHLETDSTLRDRLRELEAVTRLAQRTSGLAERRAIVDELLAALRRVGLDNAVYGTASESGLRIRRTSGVGEEALAALRARLEALDSVREQRRVPLGETGSEVVVIPVAGAQDGDGFLAGVAPAERDDQRDRVMATLARYGSVALENADLHQRQREAISRLEHQHLEAADQYRRLERILSVHETLASAVLEGRGLPSVVRSLGEFLDADMLVVAQHERVLAAWPPDNRIAWRPVVAPGRPPRTVVERDGDRHVVAAPAVLDGAVQAWIIARVASPPDDVERAALEYGALLASLELLRERTALEVETRLRAGLLEDLFSGAAVEDLVVERALAFGYDLRRRSRVFVLEAAAADGRRATPESAYALAVECAGRWAKQSLVAVHGGAVVVIVPEEPDHGGERRFEDALTASAAARLPQAPVSTAVGTECEAVEDYRTSYLAARRGLDLLRLLDRPGQVFSFRDSTLESMLLQSTRPEVVVRFIARYVTPLEDYDRHHTSELRRTLEVYYEVGGVLEEAARRLHVHVSTLRYRLKKAAQLLGIDLKDGAAALDLQVALKAERILAAHGR